MGYTCKKFFFNIKCFTKLYKNSLHTIVHKTILLCTRNLKNKQRIMKFFRLLNTKSFNY